ncbi:PhnD/SsuA/transferrin family substrate-binding protein [Mycoplasmopsis arginini]|uniref:PhnD/SsuA/transferrin family substrate-binding protein n=1 Tax=Mycoplasmopsis arginini TaxID=2094 RepID=UPI0027374546|nr:PhnD/SsuA/transferrin family substrate-binding protein [Mycoplasmopsis arginini]MDP4042700.1 PhnD/SsuA/transferrin family substrate-binding protein [Mycoplasmopsis arginini]
MKKSTKKFLLPSIIATSVVPVTFGLISSQCTPTSTTPETIKTSGYADSFIKLANKSITVAGAWSDARFYAGEHANEIEVIGATKFISNDGVQARVGLKDGDIKAIQQLLINAVNEAQVEASSGTEGNLTYLDKNNKLQSIFKIYNHDGYTPVGYESQITYDAAGNTKKAYVETPTGASEYITYNSETKAFATVAGAKEFKIQFIPSSDATLVQKATEKLQAYIASKGITNVKISVSSDYNAAAAALKAGSVDVAFLPIDTWAKLSGNSSFILQAGRNVQIIDPYASITDTSAPKFDDEKLLVEAFNHYKTFNNNNLYINKESASNPQAPTEGYTAELKTHVDSLATGAELPKVGFYRSYIYARKDSELYKIVMKALKEQGSDWKLNWEDVSQHVVYGYTSTTSAASYVYPEIWFKKHFIGFKSFLK